MTTRARRFKKTTPKIHITLYLSREMNEVLESAANKTDSTKSEVLRKAISLYAASVDARQKGMHIGFSKRRDGLDVAVEVL